MPKAPVVDFRKIRTYPYRERPSLVREDQCARPPAKGRSFREFWQGLPNILQAANLKKLVETMAASRKARQPIIIMLGAHVIKVGLNPLLIQLVKDGWISCLVMNGAGIIHDFELAYGGQTSEDVAAGIEDGSFGMVEETSRYLNQAINEGVPKGRGIGEAVGRMIARSRFPHKRLSALAACVERNIPATVHVAIGTDIIHQSPHCDGAKIGEGTMRDFQRLTQVVAQLDGGVVLNLGSAVILPEVFLKAVTIARNLGYRARGFTAATFDMHYQYRPHQNVVTRPVGRHGTGYYFSGHHEIMIPLLCQALVEVS